MTNDNNVAGEALLSNENVSSEALLNMPLEELKQYLHTHFTLTMPVAIETVADLRLAGRLLPICVANYAFLVELESWAKAKKRELRRDKSAKEAADDALSREELITAALEKTKMYYNGLSRMASFKFKVDDEINMSGHVV